MIIKYNTERLSQLIKALFDITGISISILDTDYNTLTTCSHPHDFCSVLQNMKSEKKLCEECDKNILENCSLSKKLERHICRVGLYDSAMPIIKYDTIVGYVIMGRVRSANSDPSLQYFPDTDLHTTNLLKKLYQEIPVMTPKQLTALYDILPSILFADAIQIIYDPFINKAIDFINANLKENLSVDLLCKRLNVSPNYLYEAFHKNLNSTVNEYIIEQRMKCAKERLTDTDGTVYAIAESVGIYNYTYFCKLFKKRCGVSPTEYRKVSRK